MDSLMTCSWLKLKKERLGTRQNAPRLTGDRLVDHTAIDPRRTFSCGLDHAVRPVDLCGVRCHGRVDGTDVGRMDGRLAVEPVRGGKRDFVLKYGAIADFEAWCVDGTYPARHARGRNLHACDRKRERRRL